jgi:CheY-like chemotaxis protein
VILIVDDDPRILRATSVLLREAGHEVTSFSSGAALLAKLECAPQAELLISDVQMPDMNGPELVRSATELRPDLSILFVSGDVGDLDAAAFGGHPLLAKPFTAAALLAAVDAALTSR